MNRTISTALAALAVLGAGAALVRAQAPNGATGIHDRAGMFSPEAVKKAGQALREVETSGHWQVLIETRESLDGQTAKEVAVHNAEKAKLRGLSVVISKKDHKIWTEPSSSAEKVFPDAEQKLVNAAFTRAFKENDYDQGLLDAVAEIRRAAIKVGVRDRAKMFSPEAVKTADESLEAVHRKTRWGVVIETVDSLQGKTRREAAVDNARALQVHGLYVLMARKEHQFYAEPSQSAAKVFTAAKVRAIDDAITSAFKAKDFDKGLLDAVAQIRQVAESDTSSLARAPVSAAPTVKTESSGPASPGPVASTAGENAVKTAPGPARPVAAPKNEGSLLPILFIGGGVLLLLWLISKVFRGSPQQQPVPPNAMAGGGYAPQPGPGAGYPPQARPGVPPGYAPQQPGYAPQAGPAPAPGYGYGPGGYGAPAPPHQGGGVGGFVTGALGGAAGAVAGNILYDKFGRPHESAGSAHVPGGGAPHQAGTYPADPNAEAGSAAGPPPETYDPNAGAGGDWGSPAPDGGGTDAGAGGDWGAPDPAAPDAGGDWGAAPDAPADAGADWGAAPDAPADTGGDWGGGDAGASTDDNQGGSW